MMFGFLRDLIGRRSGQSLPSDPSHDGDSSVVPAAASQPPHFKYLNGVDDPPEILALLPSDYDGSDTLPDKGWATMKSGTQMAYTRLEAACSAVGLFIRMTEGFRPRRRQAYLYAQGRDTAGKIVTHALPGKSNHQTGKAFDVCMDDKDPLNEKELARVGVIGKSVGLAWGGDWPSADTPHFQLTA